MANNSFLTTPTGILLFFLVLGVVFVNGATDASNSISGVVSSKILSFRSASVLCGVFNLLGVTVFTALNGEVARSVLELSAFGDHREVGVSACLLGVIIFSTVSYVFSLPSSESHALLSCIIGASLLISGNGALLFSVLKIVLYMIFSCALSVVLSYLLVKFLKKSRGECTKSEIATCMLSSFMHGAQDGQKFIALLIILIHGGASSDKASVPAWLCLAVGATMMLGTVLGGRRIVYTLGDGIVKTNARIALSSDLASSLSALLCSALGFSVSTGNIKACSSVGAGLGYGYAVNKSTVGKLIFISLITFPACIVLGYLLTGILIALF